MASSHALRIIKETFRPREEIVINKKKLTIKQTIEAHINTLEPGVYLHAKALWWKLFRYRVARNSVTRALNQLAKEGKVEKIKFTGSRNSE